MNVTVYLLGILLQAVAAVMALVQVRQAPRKLPWLLIAISSALIVVRRAATLGQFTQARRELAAAEVLTTVISALFFLGVVQMARMFREVSEAKAALERSTEATLEAEGKHARLFNSMPQGVAFHDAEGRILSANPSAERILGLTLDQMQGHTSLDPMWRTMHEDGSPFPGETHPAMVALRTGKPVNNEVMGVFNPTTETTRWINISAIPFFNPGESSPFQVYATFDDITEKRQAQQILAGQHARFRSYFDLGLISMAITSPEKGWVEVNNELCRALGYSREELWGMTWAELTHPDDLDKDVAQFQRVVCGEIDAYRLEKRFIRKDGTVVYTELSVQVVRNPNGMVDHFMAMFYDLTDQKQAGQALSLKQTQLQAILDYSPALISIKDLAGNVVLANRNFAVLDAPPLHELIGRNVFELFPPEIAEALWQNDLAALQSSGTVQAEERVRHKDGQWHTYLTIKFPVRDASSEPFGICAISTDITLRKGLDDTRAYLANADWLRTGEDFFQALAGFLARHLEMDFVCIDRLAEDNLSAETLAICFDGRFDPNVSYTLKETPCGEVVGKRVCCFPSGVRHQFPQDAVLQEMAAESYVGVTLWSSTGQPIGLIAVIGRQPMGDTQIAESVLALLAERAAAELELRQTEAEKQLSQAQLEQAFLNSPIGMALVGLDGRLLRVNPVFSTIVGWSEAELLEGGFQVITHPEDLEASIALAQDMIAGRSEAYQMDKRYLRKGGAEVWAQLNVSVVRDLQGTPLHFISQIQDITKRRQSEAALRESDELLMLFIRQSPIYAYIKEVTATESRVVQASENFEQLVGIKGSEMVGKTMAELFPADLAEKMAADDFSVVAGGKTLEVEEMLDDRWFFSLKFPIVQGERTLLAGFTIDITERKRAQEIIEKRILTLTQPLEGIAISFEELFDLAEIQSIQDEFAAATGVASIITHPDGTPITEPSNFTRLCSEIIRKTERGCSNCFKSDAALGRHHPEGSIVQPCLSGGLWDAGANITVGGHHVANWLIGQVRDDTQTDDQMRAYAREIGVDEASFLEAFHAVPAMSRERFDQIAKALFTLSNQLSNAAYQNVQQARFIVDRRQAEQENAKLQTQLQQSQKMESLGTLAGGVAHDMNNVLGAILGLASAHIGSHPYGSPLHQALDTICKATERGGKMVKSLLSFARQSPAESHKLDMNAILKEQVALLERTTLAKIRLEIDLEANLRPILGDASALTHAFMNLCVNAVDAMPENGTLTLHTRNVDNDWIEVVVEDNGTGMPKEVLEKAMEPFYTTKETGKGTGLGLSMVFSTVKAHRGQMAIESEPGQGTRVMLRFPACEQEAPVQAAALAATEATQIPHGTMKVLLIDDDDLIQSSVQAILEVLGHTAVTTAPSGEEALAMLEGGLEPDLVILDMNMPGLGGIGTLPRLRVLRPEVPVLLATGRVDQTALTLASAHPGVTLLPKPFGLRELQKHLESIGLG